MTRTTILAKTLDESDMIVLYFQFVTVFGWTEQPYCDGLE